MILHGDCLEQLKGLEANSIDSLLTDPPAGISFMGKEWDHHKGGRSEWIAWLASVMQECHRVMKPGAHGLVWAIPRTSHWTATALEDAGFEIRDVVTHLFGSGFPKSLDVSKAIDKAAGAEREVLGIDPVRAAKLVNQTGNVTDSRGYEKRGQSIEITAPATDAAKKWQGFGTALKPASEHWVLVRKPCSEKTVAANVLRWGTGGLNIDGSRIGYQSEADKAQTRVPVGKIDSGNNGRARSGDRSETFQPSPQGRFPANLVFSCPCESDQHMLGCAVGELDRQSAHLHSAGYKKPNTVSEYGGETSMFKIGHKGVEGQRFGDSGGASRFFYVAKVSASERNAGLEAGKASKTAQFTAKGGMKCTTCNKWKNSGNPCICADPQFEQQQWNGVEKLNSHPTVKPQKLMRYLARMITPPGGTCLDPFMGSGSTGCAAVLEGFGFVGIEREAEYLEIAQKRISHAKGIA